MLRSVLVRCSLTRSLPGLVPFAAFITIVVAVACGASYVNGVLTKLEERIVGVIKEVDAKNAGIEKEVDAKIMVDAKIAQEQRRPPTSSTP
jgi:hypothetical protein